ncbi:MAG: HlyC/CorC family transporter [Deltaproteobacteria bacterium]|nr:HlyC/CorC family transporter [Deltaproteobacteria bacterium]
MNPWWVNILIICCCIVMQGFFSGSEMVLLASNKLKLRRKMAQGSKKAALALKMIDNPRWFLSTTSTGTNMFVIISSIVAAVWFESFFKTYGELLTVIIISPFLLMFGEIIPRTIFQKRATEFAPRIAYPLWIASRIISPLTLLVFQISRLFYASLGKKSLHRKNFITREELELLLSTSGYGSDLKKKEKMLIKRVFHLVESNVSEVMIPLVHVAAIPDTVSVKAVVKIVRRTGYSRIPVFKDRIDNLIGIIYAFDLLDVPDDELMISRFIRKVPFVPELKRVDELLLFMQKSRNSIAIIVDEYGGATGIITIEDILEEVVGEISDEYDQEVNHLVRLDKNRFLINAHIEIEELNERLGLDLPKKGYETAGGFLLQQMGRIPKKGENLLYRDISFTVTKSSPRSIDEIVISLGTGTK